MKNFNPASITQTEKLKKFHGLGRRLSVFNTGKIMLTFFASASVDFRAQGIPVKGGQTSSGAMRPLTMEWVMNNRFVELLTRAATAVLFCCVLSLATGCSTSKFLSQPSVGAVSGASIQGRVHGGQQAVSGATIQLWAVGTTGYGSAATPLLGSNNVTTAADGSFSISGDYNCPAGASNGNGNAYVYITATGGNPGLTGTNPNLKLAAALGSCGALTSGTFISMNEVTTAAAAYALGQYFNISTGSFGAPNTTQGQIGLVNAFATVNSLVSLPTGNAITSATLTATPLPSGNPSVSVTMTPESAKLNTVADILAACVNSLGTTDPGNSSCNTLFGAVFPTGGTAPTDTLQAAVDMSMNPTSTNANGSTTNLAALYALVTAQAPFVGAALQPTDWTIGIQYTDTTTGTFLLSPQNIAADSSGNVWVLNGTSPGSLVEVSPTGTPMSNTLQSSTAGTGINTFSPRNLAIDLNNNAWATTSSSGANVFEVSPAGATLGTFATSKSSYGLAIDGNNNVFVGTSSTSAHFQLIEALGGNVANLIEFPIATSTPGSPGTNGTSTFLNPQYMAFDTAGNLWMTNGSATPTSGTGVVQLSSINTTQCPISGTFPCPQSSISASGTSAVGITTQLTPTPENVYTLFAPSGAAFSAPFGIAAGANTMWVGNSGSSNNTVSKISLDGGTGSNLGTGSVTSARYVAVDGAGSAWFPQHGGASGGNELTEYSSTGTVLSTVSSGTAPFIATGYAHPGLASAYGITIDPSGNVWVANNTTTAGIFELVGAAAPTVTPLALQLKNNTVAQKP